MDANKMDRGTDALKSHMNGLSKLEVHQTRKGCLQECLGCEARTEFKYYANGTQVFESLEDADCCCRLCCAPNHPFKMAVKELNTGAEIVTVDRPFRCFMGNCKCCCYQTAEFSSGGSELGKIEESCWYCVPSFYVYDHKGTKLYHVHPPTCMGGICINCFAEGNPFGRGCCRSSFRVYPGEQSDTDGDAPYLGVILKMPKGLGAELFTDADKFEVSFPQNANAAQKGILIGTTIFLNAVFFEGAQGDSAV